MSSTPQNSKIKIGLVGNMNNMLFQQQRYLADWGFDTTLFLLEEYDHFMPEADVFFDPASAYKIVKLGWNMEDFYKIKSEDIYALFKDFDFLIGTDLAPAYLYKGGLKLDLFSLHGNDLYEYPFFRLSKKQPSLWEINRVQFSIHQFEGIKLANYIALNKTDDFLEKPLSQIRKSGKRTASPPFIYTPQFNHSYFTNSSLSNLVSELKNKFGFIALHHSSHNWYTESHSQYTKHNNKVIQAFAQYLKSSAASKKGVLVMVEYGPDIPKSRELIDELGISDNVVWIPKQQRKNLLCLVNGCDIGIGEMSSQGWLVYSVVVELMIMSKPMIHHRKSQQYEKDFKTLYPMVDTNDPNVVANALLDFEQHRDKYMQMGREANQWFTDNLHSAALHDLRASVESHGTFSNKITPLDRLRYSNKAEQFKAWRWKIYNIARIKFS